MPRTLSYLTGSISDLEIPGLGGAKRNTLRAFAGSLRPAASGMQGFYNFCQFPGRPPFPVDTDTVLLRSTMFRPGRTFGQYIAHVMKASILLRQPTDWLTPDVRSASRGLKNAQDLSFRFHNFILAGDLIRLLRTCKLTSPCEQAAFLSFLFLFRVPSEALMLIRAEPSGRIAEFSPKRVKALVDVRTINGLELLVAKFAWGKNIRHGCILRRPCLCSDLNGVARLLRPVHMIWPLITARVRIGERMLAGSPPALLTGHCGLISRMPGMSMRTSSHPTALDGVRLRNYSTPAHQRTLPSPSVVGTRWDSGRTSTHRWRTL